jgi:hypothetical protein
MKLFKEQTARVVEDIKCDVCGANTLAEGGVINAGCLHAAWGYGSKHDGDRYEVDLCEACFFSTLSYLKRERQSQRLFMDEAEGNAASAEGSGLIEPSQISLGKAYSES